MTPSDKYALSQGCYLDEDKAQHVLDFFTDCLIVPKGKRQGEVYTPLPWQWEEVIRPLYAWRRPDGTRLKKRGYVSVAKQNGKSNLLASLLLYELVTAPRYSELYAASVDRLTASNIYRAMAQFVQRSPQLSTLLDCIDSTKTIHCRTKGSFFRSLANVGSKTSQGVNAKVVVYDELHLYSNTDEEQFDSLRYSGVAVDDSWYLSITTAGDDENSLCYRQYEYAKKIISGELIDETFLTYIAEPEPEADIDKEATWKAANPAYGTLLDPTDFRHDYLEAQRTPSRMAAFKRYRLNLWIEPEAAYLDMAAWKKCNYEVDPKTLEGKQCYAGLDLSTRVDLTSLVLIFPIYEDGQVSRFDVLPYFFVPKEQAQRRKDADDVPYPLWISQGEIIATPGNMVDQGFVRKKINELAEKYYIKALAVDPWNAAKLIPELMGDGLEVIEYRQGYRSMSEPTKLLEGLVLEGKLNHFANPVLTWQAGNAIAERDPADNVKLTKAKSKERIDGVICLVMCLGLYLADGEEEFTATIFF